MKLANLLINIALPERVGALEIKGLALDSRRVQEGDLFIAIGGTRTDGKKFISQAREKGAVAVLIEATNENGIEIIQSDSVVGVPVPNLAAQLSSIAGRFYGEPSKRLEVIGITGTNGKSTCVSLLAQASELMGNAAWQLGTLGFGKPGAELIDTGLTTPDAISCQKILAQAEGEVSLVAMEVSSHAVVQNRVSGISFKAGVFTNITRDHLDFHETFEAYGEAKLQFLRDVNMDFVVLNFDDEFANKIIRGESASLPKVYSFSLSDKRADVWAELETLSLSGISARIHSPWGEGLLVSSLVGEFNLSNLLAVICVLAARGHPFPEILNAVKKLKGVDGRLQKVEVENELENSPAVFIDYAHTPDALLKALAGLSKLNSGEMWLVFGCGGDRDKGKRPLMAEIAESHAQYVVITSDNPRTEDPQLIIDDIVGGLKNKNSASVFIDRRQAIEYAVNKLPDNGCLLVAGKGHEKYQIVGDQRLPFDDYVIAQNALLKRIEHRGLTR